MEITGIYQELKETIENLKTENETLNDENIFYSNQCYQLLARTAELEKKYEELVENQKLEKIQKDFYKRQFENKPKQEPTPAVIELTRQQVYHLMDFIEDNETIETVVLKMSCESGIGPTLTAKATVELDLTDYSTW